jgi:hypothetical protein
MGHPSLVCTKSARQLRESFKSLNARLTKGLTPCGNEHQAVQQGSAAARGVSGKGGGHST